MNLVTYVSFVLVTNSIMDIRITFVSFIVFNSFRVPFYHIPMNILSLHQVSVDFTREIYREIGNNGLGYFVGVHFSKSGEQIPQF